MLMAKQNATPSGFLTHAREFLAHCGDSAAMINRPDVALAALVNRLALKVFSRGYISNPIETGKKIFNLL